MSREFLESRGVADVYAYGQTPLTTIDKVARQCGLHSKDVVYELGCGTARSCFWLASFVKCQAVGIDYLPAFIDHALRVKKRWNADLVTLRCENLFHADLRLASVVYVYGTNFEEKEILELIVLLKNVRRGTKIITVSYPLTDYTKEPLFRLTKQFQGSFPWGKATIYLQIKQ